MANRLPGDRADSRVRALDRAGRGYLAGLLMATPESKRYIYVADKAARAYQSPYVDQSCVRAGPWVRGKAIMRFDDGALIVCLVGNGRMRIKP